MRQINFLIIFVICLALVLFSLENTEAAAIQVIPGVKVQAPLAVELLLAMGIGAVLAWVFSVWSQIGRMLDLSQPNRQIRQQDERIQELEQNLQQYKAELERQPPMLAAGEATVTEVSPTDAYVQ